MTDTQDALDFLNGDMSAEDWSRMEDEQAPWEQDVNPLEQTIMSAMQTTQISDADIIRKARQTLGRKFEIEDLTDSGEAGSILYEIACRWLPTVTAEISDNDWLLDLAKKFRQGGGLSDRQAKGVLNFYAASLTRKQYRQREDDRDSAARHPSRPQIAADDDDLNYDIWLSHVLTNVSKGYYTIARPNKHRTYHVSEWTEDSRDPTKRVRFIKMRIAPGDDLRTDYTLVGVQNETDGSYRTVKDYSKDASVKSDLDILFDLNPETRNMMREAYAVESGNCARCGARLTVPTSIHRGVGPECAKHVGW